MVSEFDVMAVRASMVLYKFSEGEEDYSEWEALAHSLEGVLPKLSTCTAEVVKRRLDDYWSRRIDKPRIVG